MSAGPSDLVSTFLNIVESWEPDTYVNIHTFLYQDGRILPKATRAARDLGEAASFVRWADSMGWECYVCMSSQKNPGTAKLDKRKQVHYRALRGEANAVRVKSFFIDVDVKQGAYGSPEEAIQAVQTFCGTVGLPLPALAVGSGGGGFHAHWVLEEPITPEIWKPLAHKLADACRTHNLKADHNVTVDIARILRVPGTHNRKYGAPPRKVTLEVLGPAVSLAAFSNALEGYSDSGGSPRNSSVNLVKLTHNDSLDPTLFPGEGSPFEPGPWLAGISSGGFTLEELSAEGGCPWIREALATGGKNHNEPQWFMAGHVAIFTEGEVQDFHKLSEKHGNYSPAETDEKFARILESKRVKDQGWPRCQTIQNAGAKDCAGCKHLPENKSPLNFAVVTPPSNPQGPGGSGDKSASSVKHTTVDVPGYDHCAHSGIVSMLRTDKKGEPIAPVPLMNAPIWNPDYKEDHHGRLAVHFDTQLAQQQPVHVTVPTTEMRNGDMLRGCLVGRFGLPIQPGLERGWLGYMASFKDRMRETRNTIDRQELMGWSEDNGKPAAFIYGPTRFNCSGHTPFNQPDAMVRDQYFPTGSNAPWQEAIRMINAEQRPEMDLLVATAFAAPLMRFTGEKGVVISAYSNSSAVHKTTALKIGQSVWGAFESINQLSDTLNSVMERVGRTRVMPIYYDEMKSSTDIKRFAEMVYMMAGGRGKGRLNRVIELRDVNTWDTLLVGVSNDSLFDYVSNHDRSTDAGVARIFEFEVAGPNGQGQVPMGTAGEILKKLESNYGHAGLRYAEMLGQSVDSLPGQVSAKVNQLQKELGSEQEERFWLSAAAVLLIGAQLANDINLTRFDVGRMHDFIKVTFQKMRAAKGLSNLDISKSNSVVNVLTTYVTTHRRSIMATDMPGQKGRINQLNPVMILNHADIHLVNEFTIRYIQNGPLMQISKSALVEWLHKRQLSPGVFIKNMMTLYGAKEVFRNITAGTAHPGARERAIELDLNHPDLVDLYEV